MMSPNFFGFLCFLHKNGTSSMSRLCEGTKQTKSHSTDEGTKSPRMEWKKCQQKTKEGGIESRATVPQMNTLF
jgi:hypothetical protein